MRPPPVPFLGPLFVGCAMFPGETLPPPSPEI